MNNDFDSKYGCCHTPINMVPERDTGPSKMNTGQVNTVGSLRLPACRSSGQSNSKFKSEINSNDEHRMLANRPHHHVSVQELRLQVSNIISQLWSFRAEPGKSIFVKC